MTQSEEEDHPNNPADEIIAGRQRLRSLFEGRLDEGELDRMILGDEITTTADELTAIERVRESQDYVAIQMMTGGVTNMMCAEASQYGIHERVPRYRRQER